MTSSTVHPAVTALAQVLLEELPSLSAAMASHIRASESTYAEVPDLDESCADHLSFVLGELAGLPRDTRRARAAGRRRAEDGVPLSTLLRAYRLGARFIGDLLIEHATPATRNEILLGTIGAAWEMLEEYSEAVASAYAETMGRQTRADEAARNAAVAALLAGGLDAERMVDAAVAAGLPVHGRYVVVSSSAGVGSRLRGRRVTSAWNAGLDVHEGIVVLPARGSLATMLESAAARTGLSAPFDRLDLAPAAAREARAARQVARLGEVVDYDQRPLDVLVASAPDAAAHLVRRVLGPVLAGREPDVLLATLAAWFDCGGSASRTAAALYVHRNTVGYRVSQLQALTGRDLTDARDAAELLVALRAHEIASSR